MEFKQSILALSVLTVLAGCGGSSDDNSEVTNPPVVTDPETPTVSEAQINGVASKGTLKNAQLTFYKYVEGSAVELTDEELGDSSLVTDENGQYLVTLNDIQGVVKVELSVSSDADSPTIMVCDAPTGCGVGADDVAIKFGENVNLTLQDPEFSLTSILSVSSDSADTQDTANITPLTHMATALAESRGDVSEQTISDAQSEIANTFGLVGALNSLTPGAIETPSSLFDQENTNAMRYALINAGIAHALYIEEPDLSLSAKLKFAIDDMVAANGGMLVSADADDDDEFELSIEDVLNGSEQALTQLIEVIAEDPSLVEHLDDLEQIATNIANEIQVKLTQADDEGRIKGSVSDETQGDAIAKASAMVNDIRLFANLFDVTNSSGEHFESQGEQFVNLVEAAGDMVAEQGDSFALLSDVIEAVTDIHQQLENEEVTGTVFDLADYLSTAGTGSVTIDEENLVFSVDAQAGAEKLTLDVAINALAENTQYQLLLSGMAENDAVALTIGEGSHATLSLDSAVTRSQIESGDVNAEPTKGELKLSVTLAQKATDTVANPVSFTGNLTAELLPLRVYSTESLNGWEQTAWDYTLEQDTLVLPKMASLSGEFSSLDGEFVKATATVNIKDLESYVPPELKGFGEMYEGIAEITINEANTALNLSVNDDETVTAYTFVKTAPDAGNWKVSANRTTDIEGYFQGSFTREAFTYQGVQFYLYNYYNEVNDDYYGYVEFIEQVEFDEYYQPFVVKRHYQYFKEYNDGVLITEDGSSIAVLDIMFNNYGEYHDYYDALNGLNIGIQTPVEQISTITDYFDDAFANDFSVAVGDKGSYRLIFDDNDTSLAAGLNIDLDGYLVSPILEDMLTITVSDEAATLQASVQDGEVQTINVAKSSETNFSVDNVTVSKSGDFVQSETLSVITQGEGLAQTTTVEFFDRYLDGSWGRYEKLTAIDNDDDQIADSLDCINFDFHSKTADGLYYDYDGNLIDINEQSGDCGHFANFTEFAAYSWQFSRFGINGENLANFTAVDTFKSRLYSINPPSISGEEPTFEPVYYRSFVSGLGEIRADFTQPEHMQWSADGTYTIDMYLTQPELGTNVENEETFLDVNAALNVQVKVGEYNLELNLTGERTELEQGKLALDVKYQLPESDKLRSFIVSYDTKLETLSATNAENVKLILADSDDEQAEQQVLGTIMVGDEKAAEIVKRDSLVLIVYENGTVETL
ncbi:MULTISPECIES: hypothetical protein [unclassified Pseudoalteromonas]|uniref:hypothetical protein n=1 Tax=unclassified Pseudoalteromonas TaxID=194690 RepID=UPI0025B2B34A|nr:MULTISPECIES: hypothetical protein [unclassified Pseudoalteromonas]MDN3378272.1 hypothetical protein [Pseudoalteromonas sp. APC 3893]MDN3386192.1 hypothetical protein [Pseudoalteromonas sp. APC 4017]